MKRNNNDDLINETKEEEKNKIDHLFTSFFFFFVFFLSLTFDENNRYEIKRTCAVIKQSSRNVDVTFTREPQNLEMTPYRFMFTEG